MTATQSKLEKLSFSGKDEDFAVLKEQFEARMHMLNLRKCLEDKLTVPAYKEDETRGEKLPGSKQRTSGRSSASWSGASLISAWTRLQSTSYAFTSRTAWKPGKPLWGSTAAPRGPPSRRCSLSWLAQGEKMTDYLNRAERVRLDLQ